MASSENRDKALEDQSTQQSMQINNNSEVIENIDDDDDDDDMFEDVTLSSVMNLMPHIWNSAMPVITNVKLIIGFIQSYIAEHKKTGTNEFRMVEVKLLKRAVINLLAVWKNKKRGAAFNDTFTVEQLNAFLHEEKLFDQFAQHIMTTDSLFAWAHEFREYINRRFSADISRKKESCAAIIDGAKKRGGMEMLFASSSSSISISNDGIQQYVTQLDNGRLCTVRSPGESGCTLIRMDIYDVNAIKNIEKRQWWKHAKMRTQFLISSPEDSKYQLVNHLMDSVADDLIKVPGVMKEVSRM